MSVESQRVVMQAGSPRDETGADPSGAPSLPPAGFRSLALITLGLHLLGLALPLALLQVYDRILPNQALGTLALLVIGVATAIGLEALLRWVRAAAVAHHGANLEARALRRAFNGLLAPSPTDTAHVDPAASGDAVRAIGVLRDRWSGSASLTLLELPFALMYLALIAWVGGALVAIPLALLVLGVLAVWSLTLRGDPIALHAEHAEAKRNRWLWGVLGSLTGVKGSGLEPVLLQHLRQEGRAFHSAQAAMELTSASVKELVSLLAQLATLLMVIFGVGQVVDGALTTGALSACTLLAGRALGPLMGGVGYLARRSRFLQAEARLQSLRETASPQSPVSALPTTGGASLAVAAAAAPGHAPTILVPGGGVLWVHAANGVEASSWLTHLVGANGPPPKNVLIDGIEPTTWRANVSPGRWAWVPRRPAVYPGTVLDNLTWYDPKLRPQALSMAAQIGLIDLLQVSGSGIMATMAKLSAEPGSLGLLQRIALVRALVRSPSLLLLDHAADVLDLDGERRLLEVLAALRGHTTVVMATARPALQALATHRLDLTEKAA